MSDVDRIIEPLNALIRAVMRGVDYHAWHPCKVMSQNSDFTLELKPDNAKIPQQSKIPMRMGLPGMVGKVTSGRCLLGWEGGDPQRPVASHFEVGTIDTLFFGGTSVTGSDVTAFVALADLVDARLSTIKSAFDGHTHSTPLGACTAGGAVGIVATSINPSMGSLPSVAASKVKAK